MAVLLDLTRCDRNLSYNFIVSIRVRLGGRSAPFADRHYNNMCGTADNLMLTQYVGTAESLMVTQYVRYSRQFNGDTICAVLQTV